MPIAPGAASGSIRAHNFDFPSAPRLTAPQVRATLSQCDKTPGEGWSMWAFRTTMHRAVSRWAHERDTPPAARLNILLLALRGNPTIDQRRLM
jgi:hypothetical protein